MNKNKLISFDAWFGGMNNIRMTYELVGALSYVTGRSIVLPPNQYCLFLAEHHDKDSFFDWWTLFDKERYTSQFSCVEYEDTPLTLFSSDTQWFEGISGSIKTFMFGDEYQEWGPQEFPGKSVLYHYIHDQEHFDHWVRDGRKHYNIYSDEGIIHFPRNLFGHFGYHVYPPNDEARDIIKDKVREGVRFRQEFYDQADTLITGSYNSVHIRRGDFKSVRPEIVQSQYDNLLESLDNKIGRELPLFIATDEQDLSIFDFLKEHYEIIFLSDLVDTSQKQPHELLALDTILASRGEIFFGSTFSTFSDYINILRLYENRRDTHLHTITQERVLKPFDKYPWETNLYQWNDLWKETYI